MANAILAQDWITIRGNSTSTTVTMQERDYIDLLQYQDAVAFLEAAEVINGPNLEFQTGPTRDDVLFKQIDSTVSFTPAIGVTTKVMRYASVTVPLSRYFRWKVTGSSTAAWSLTFRLWLSPCFA